MENTKEATALHLQPYLITGTINMLLLEISRMSKGMALVKKYIFYQDSKVKLYLIQVAPDKYLKLMSEGKITLSSCKY